MVDSLTRRLGVSLSIRNGYSEYALYVNPPPHGFSHASFSSNTVALRPALARRSAAKAPAGPPPKIATVFIVSNLSADVRAEACLPATTLAMSRHPNRSEDVLPAAIQAKRNPAILRRPEPSDG